MALMGTGGMDIHPNKRPMWGHIGGYSIPIEITYMHIIMVPIFSAPLPLKYQRAMACTKLCPRPAPFAFLPLPFAESCWRHRLHTTCMRQFDKRSFPFLAPGMGPIISRSPQIRRLKRCMCDSWHNNGPCMASRLRHVQCVQSVR